MVEYATLWDEANFRADAELRGKWVLRGWPTLVDSGRLRRSEKGCCCLAG